MTEHIYSIAYLQAIQAKQAAEAEAKRAAEQAAIDAALAEGIIQSDGALGLTETPTSVEVPTEDEAPKTKRSRTKDTTSTEGE